MSGIVTTTTSPNGFVRTTLPGLIQRAQTDIEAKLRGSAARLPLTNLDALAAMSAGQADEQLDAIDFYATQIHVTTATETWLERHGSEWGVPRKGATVGTGKVWIYVTPGTDVPSGTLFQTDARTQVITTSAGSSPIGQAIMVDGAAVLTGPSGNLPSGTMLNTVNPVRGVTGAMLETTFAGGNDIEGIEAYRNRILARIQQPPEGGAGYDYLNWMLAYPGCTRSWVKPKEQGIGTVVCRFAMDDTYTAGIPSAEEVARMAQWIDVRRPVTAEVFVYSPVPRPIAVTVLDLSPNTVQVQTAVKAELEDMLVRQAEPGSTVEISWFWEAVSVASGERSHKIVTPADSVTMLPGQLGVLGDLQFIFTTTRGR
jgi:uncharacterized phage protein gp47/JayE